MSALKYLCRLCFLPICLVATLAISCCYSQPQATYQPINTYTYQIVNIYPHDPDAFTEGLAFDNGFLYEGTGLYGKSSLRQIDLETGKVLQMRKLSADYFGEGITVYDNTIIQLTYQSYEGFVYDKDDFSLLRQFSYPLEGWGITNDGKRLITSNGTSTLHLLNPDTQKFAGEIDVRDDNKPVNMLNELEYINGKIYANVWKTDRIAIIEPEDGHVTGWIDLSGLLQTQNYSGTVDLLNGIAYDPKSDRLFVTGKLWPFLFEIKVVAED